MATFGTGLASVLLCGLGVAIEALALGLPSLAAMLARQHDRAGARIAWVLWVPAVAMALINSCGFSSRYIGDSVAAREQVTDQAQGRREELAHLKAQRASVKELRSVAELETLMATAQAQAAVAYRRSGGCVDITKAETAELCKPHQQARAARAQAIQRDSLDKQIRELETAIAAMPSVALADPGAQVAADMINWLTHGLVTLSTHDFQILRILILTLMPAFAGPLLGLAVRLGGSRRDQVVNESVNQKGATVPARPFGFPLPLPSMRRPKAA
jgi:cell division protein FtsB